MKVILDEMLAALSRGERVVLCSILASSGSVPRGAGAKMAVLEDGRVLGTIGGGAVERLSIEHARRALNDGGSNDGYVDNGGSNNGGGSNGGYIENGGSSNGGGSSSQPSYNPSTGNAVVDRAYSKIGCWYSWGAVGPDTFDCSGLVSYALTGSYSRLGTTYTFMAWPQVSDPQPGDICTSSYHCGIYIGGGQMIHAPQQGEQVKVGPVQSDMIIVRCPW